jgi:hypothetical protein
MYIEFDLPQGSSDIKSTFSTDLTLKIIRDQMQSWSEQYGIPYREKTIKYKHRVTFEQDELYSFWAITWNAERKYYATSQYCIVSDLNNKI